MSNEKTKFVRNCPNCSSDIKYKSKQSYQRGMCRNSVCKSCRVGENHHMYGKTRPEHSQRMKGQDNPNYGKECVWSGVFGEDHPRYGKKFKKSADAIKKTRIAILKRIETSMIHGNQLTPNYNPSSISPIEEKARELGITDLQHAENGGEFYIKELGYWVDGYSAEKNIVIEYDEPHHKYQVEKDKKREKEIVEYLNCKFIRISQK